MTRKTTESPSLLDRLAHVIERSLGLWFRPQPQPVPARVTRPGLQRVPPRRR